MFSILCKNLSIRTHDQHDTILMMYLCLSRRIKEDEREGSSELDNDGAAAHALEAAPVDDSIV